MIRPNEVECWAFGIPNLPIFPNRRVRKFIKYINGLQGFIGFHPMYPRGTLLVFDTENNAKGGRNLIKCYEGYDGTVGNIGAVYIPKDDFEQARRQKNDNNGTD